MKQSIMMKEKGFTLLELLVVVAIIGILSAGALLAYEGLTEKAQASVASNNTANADQSIRNFRAVTQSYPDQFDNLVVQGGGALEFAPSLQDWLAEYTVALPAADGDGNDRFIRALQNVGIEELQTRLITAETAGVEPNLQHNEGALGAAAATDVQEAAFAEDTDDDGTLTDETLDTDRVAIVPSFNGDTNAACTLETGTYPAATISGAAIDVTFAQRLNAINDRLEDDQCNLVVALGFGHDAAHSTSDSSVAIATAPTYISQNVNPTEDYARYVALFHVASDEDEDGQIDDADYFENARLIAVVDTEGNIIAENIADATDETQN